jgi:hypothetical protein
MFLLHFELPFGGTSALNELVQFANDAVIGE